MAWISRDTMLNVALVAAVSIASAVAMMGALRLVDL